MRAVLGIAVVLGGVALLAAVISGVGLAYIPPTAADGSPNNPAISQDQQHKGTSTGGTQ